MMEKNENESNASVKSIGGTSGNSELKKVLEASKKEYQNKDDFDFEQ